MQTVKKVSQHHEEALARAKALLGDKHVTAPKSTFKLSSVTVLDAWKAQRIGVQP